MLVDPHKTYKKSSGYRMIIGTSLSICVHACPVGALVKNRDENAVNIILRLGLESLGFAREAPAFRRGELSHDHHTQYKFTNKVSGITPSCINYI